MRKPSFGLRSVAGSFISNPHASRNLLKPVSGIIGYYVVGRRIMDNKKYVEGVLKTESNNFEAIADRASQKRNVRLLHSAMGLSTEANELVDQMKKVIFYGKELDVTNFIEEVGDALWYLAVACDELGVSFEEVMELNINKLKARYGNKFTEDAALNRDLETERKILEGDGNRTLEGDGNRTLEGDALNSDLESNLAKGMTTFSLALELIEKNLPDTPSFKEDRKKIARQIYQELLKKDALSKS